MTTEEILNNWDSELESLEAFFGSIALPDGPLKINNYSTITDPTSHVKSQFTMAKANPKNKSFISCLIRLRELREYFTNNL